MASSRFGLTAFAVLAVGVGLYIQPKFATGVSTRQEPTASAGDVAKEWADLEAKRREVEESLTDEKVAHVIAVIEREFPGTWEFLIYQQQPDRPRSEESWDRLVSRYRNMWVALDRDRMISFARVVILEHSWVRICRESCLCVTVASPTPQNRLTTPERLKGL